MEFDAFVKKMEDKIVSAYEESVTVQEAEQLAGEFLYAQMVTSQELRVADLNARMSKSGVKAIRATIYLEESKKGDKKPTEATLSAIIDSNEIVLGQQQDLDASEVAKAELERLYDVFLNAHIHFRGLAKGNM